MTTRLVKHESMWSTRQLKSFANLDISSTKRSKFHDSIVHQISIEIDSLPVEVVVFVAGKMGDEPLYDIGAAFAAEGTFMEACCGRNFVKFDEAVDAAESLSNDHEKIITLF